MHVAAGQLVLVMVCTGGCTGWVRDGMGIGWYGEGIPGTQPTCSRRSPVQRSGPRRACRARSGWYWGPGARCSMTHPAGPVGPPAVALPGHASAFQSNGRANREKARFHDISLKVSQKTRVSPKSVHKACHSPCLQNGLEKSPLDILRFPIIAAFSHKELMGLFWLRCMFTVKTTKCRQVCTPVSREVVADTPTDNAASCLCCPLLICSARYRPWRNLIELGSIRKLGTFWPQVD